MCWHLVREFEVLALTSLRRWRVSFRVAALSLSRSVRLSLHIIVPT